jgi:flagellar L-ring protein FlgH
MRTSVLALLLCTSLTGCMDVLDKLERAGKPPAMSEVKDPTREPSYAPISWPMPEAKSPPAQQYANSLWQPGSRAFFRDQRASRVGDILRVKIKINDKAEVGNETERKRDVTENLDTPSVFGVEELLVRPLPKVATPSDLLNITSNTNTKGKGSVKRQDTVDTMVAALIIQVLPNGNYVIDGKQEIRVNYDVREVSIKGVVRPQDITTDNTVDSTQVAEARIVYGGRGQLMDVQQPRWGSQVIETLSPF